MHRKALTMLIRIFLITGDKKLTRGSQTFSVISLEGRRVSYLELVIYIQFPESSYVIHWSNLLIILN